MSSMDRFVFLWLKNLIGWHGASQHRRIEVMTIGEKNIIATTLNALQNNDLISSKALSKAFEALKLPREYKLICKGDIFNFVDETQCVTQHDFAELGELQE